MTGSPTRSSALHLVVTYEPGTLVAYCDGKEVMRTDRVQGDFSNWIPQHLLFGDEWNGERTWAGVLEGIAIYNRALTPQEALEHAAAYRRLRGARKPAPRLQVEAVLAKMSRIPTLKEIRPYKHALALYEYRVSKVIAGKYDARTIRVARWVLLNGATLPAAAEKPGLSANLTLEPFDANLQLASQYLSDTLPENWDVKLYFRCRKPLMPDIAPARFAEERAYRNPGTASVTPRPTQSSVRTSFRAHRDLQRA